MTRAANADARAEPRRVEAPLVWTFDNRRFADCLQDMEDTLRRAIVQLGDVSRVLVAIDLSLPALKARVQAGEPIQPAWGEFLARLANRYGLPSAPRVRYTKAERPLAAFVIAYRS